MNDFAKLFAHGPLLMYKKGMIISSPSSPPKGIYRVKSGYLYSYSLANKRKKVQSVIGPGGLFPLLWATNTTRRLFYLEALTEMTLSLLDKDVFFERMYESKELSKAFIAAFASYLRIYVDRVENLEFETLDTRVQARILHFGEHFGSKRDKHIYIDFPLTQGFIAQSINGSRENVSREITKLEKEGIISLQKKQLIILKPDVLREMVYARSTV